MASVFYSETRIGRRLSSSRLARRDLRHLALRGRRIVHCRSPARASKWMANRFRRRYRRGRCSFDLSVSVRCTRQSDDVCRLAGALHHPRHCGRRGNLHRSLRTVPRGPGTRRRSARGIAHQQAGRSRSACDASFRRRHVLVDRARHTRNRDARVCPAHFRCVDLDADAVFARTIGGERRPFIDAKRRTVAPDRRARFHVRDRVAWPGIAQRPAWASRAAGVLHGAAIG